jgi:hypothetical protein
MKSPGSSEIAEQETFEKSNTLIRSHINRVQIDSAAASNLDVLSQQIHGHAGVWRLNTGQFELA